MRPVPVFPDYLVKLVIPASRAILKPAAIYRFVSLKNSTLEQLEHPQGQLDTGTGIASVVVKVKGEDPATPGLLPKGIDPGTVPIPQYRVNKTKQHTHTHT